MAASIDIHNLTLEELSGVVDIYPWFAGARVLLCRRMHEQGSLGEDLLASAAIYSPSRRALRDMLDGEEPSAASDKDAASLIQAYLPDRAGKQVYVVGGDYFPQSRYNEMRQSDGGFMESLTRRLHDNESAPQKPAGEAQGDEEFYTETLAKIYLDQDYADKAVEIYSKLSLRNPEKSVYFAALIDEINKNNNNK